MPLTAYSVTAKEKNQLMFTAHQDNSLQRTGHIAFPYLLFLLSPAKQSTQSRSTRTKTPALTQVLSNKLSGPVFPSIKGDSKLCVGCLLVLQWLATPGTQYGPWKYYQCYCSAALLSPASITDTAPSRHIQYLQLHDIPQDGCSTTALGCSLRNHTHTSWYKCLECSMLLFLGL